MRGNVDVEHADLIVGEDQLVVRLGRDFHSLRALRGEEAG
jgi:hypothetical protein